MEHPLKIQRREDGRLMAIRDGGEPVVVRARRCFPWVERGGYITLRDGDEKEVALIKRLDELDAESRLAVEAGLAESAFVLEVDRLEAIETEFEIRVWRVHTRQGPFVFQTKLDEWPRKTPQGGLLVRDVAGNLFHIANPRQLDRESQKLLWAYID
jgi:hypothetical protein